MSTRVCKCVIPPPCFSHVFIIHLFLYKQLDEGWTVVNEGYEGFESLAVAAIVGIVSLPLCVCAG